MPQEDIEKAVTEAVGSQAGEEGSGGTQAGEKTQVQDTKPEEKKTPEVDQRTVQALQLLDMLENPKTAKGVVGNLMQQLGIELPETKKEERLAVKTAKEVIREKLGPDFEFLSDKLGEAIEEVLSLETKKVRDEVLTIEQARNQRELAREYNDFLAEHKVSEEEAGELSKLVDEIPPTGNIPLSKYLGRLLKMHRSEVAEQKAELAKRQRQKENLSRRPETSGIEGNEDRVSKGSRKISAREAVEAALRGEKLD